MQQYFEAAHANIERNLADAVDGDLDNIAEHMYTLAHDAVMDLCNDPQVAQNVAVAIVHGG